MHASFVFQGPNLSLKVQEPIVMGILNITPDSFYDGNKHKDNYLQHVEQMLNDGASIIDIGAMTSKPGSPIIDAQIEIDRLKPVLQGIAKTFPQAFLSVDTVQSKVAKFAIEEGVSMINDISAGEIEDELLDLVAAYKMPYICMHMKGVPLTMHQNPNYESVVKEVLQYFQQRLTYLKEKGISQILIDPGFGFGKSIAQNFQLLRELKQFNQFQLPLLIGLSRKSMIWKSLGISPEEALNGTTALHMIALKQGAQILRVHDVKEAMQCIRLYKATYGDSL